MLDSSRSAQAEGEAFLALLSHELRTPLTTIYAGSSVLARRPSLSPAVVRSLARDISSEAAHLYDLVENLLVLARLDRHVLEPIREPVDIRLAIDAASRFTRERVPRLRIARTGSRAAPAVAADATYVEQACRNLVLAAVRLGEPDDDLDLEIHVEVDRGAGEVRVRFRDHHAALSGAELARVLELPSASPTGRLAGVGVGPFVASRAIAAMHGRTWARNRPGGGLEMGFALAIDRPAGDPEPDAGDPAAA